MSITSITSKAVISESIVGSTVELNISDFSNLKAVLRDQQLKEDLRAEAMNKANKPKIVEESEISKIYHIFNGLDDYSHLRMAQFPKTEKFIIVKEIKLLLLSIERLLVECALKYHKKTTLTNLNIEIEIFRKYISRSHRRGFIKDKTRDSWMRKINHLGDKVEKFTKSNPK